MRNNSWLEDSLFEFLKEHTIALVLSDSPWLDQINKVTSSFVYFRWEGNRKQINGTKGIVEKDRTVQVQSFASKIQSFSDEMEVFCYFSKYFSGHPPTDAKKLLDFLKVKHYP